MDPMKQTFSIKRAPAQKFTLKFRLKVDKNHYSLSKTEERELILFCLVLPLKHNQGLISKHWKLTMLKFLMSTMSIWYSFNKHWISRSITLANHLISVGTIQEKSKNFSQTCMWQWTCLKRKHGDYKVTRRSKKPVWVMLQLDWDSSNCMTSTAIQSSPLTILNKVALTGQH